MTFIERHFPTFYRSDGWQSSCLFVKAPYFEYAVDIILVLNAIVVGIQSWPELAADQKVVLDQRFWDGSIDTLWELIEAIFTLIYVLEAWSKIASTLARGPTCLPRSGEWSCHHVPIGFCRARRRWSWSDRGLSVDDGLGAGMN